MDYHLTWIYAGLLSLIYAATGSSPDQYRCPNSDRRRTQAIRPYRDRCYQFVHEERYWTSARDYCRDHGGRLVTVNDARTNQFIISTLNSLPWTNSGVWIGLHDRDKELRWQWSTESEYVDEPVRFTYWARGHPKAFLHSIRDCVRMVRKSSWKWHETACSALKWKYRFICEYAMLPPSTTPAPPTYPAGFHEAQQGMNWGQGWARPPPPDTDNSDVRITADDVMVASTTKSPNKASTTTTPEFYKEDSIDVIVPMQLRQDQGKDDGRGNMIFGIVGCVVGLLCILAFIIVVILMKRRRRKEEEHSGDNPLYGATDEDEFNVKVKGLKVRPGVNPGGGRVMNIYTNPSEHMDQMTALQRLQLVGSSSEEEMTMLMSPGGESNGSDLDDENIRNERLEDASQYLEPQSCMAHRPLPEVGLKLEHEVKSQGHQLDPEVKAKVKRKPQRFVRPKSPVPVNPSKDSQPGKVSSDSSIQNENPEELVENLYEDAEDVDENVYAEIPGDNIYESLDEMKKSLAAMGEAEA